MERVYRAIRNKLKPSLKNKLILYLVVVLIMVIGIVLLGNYYSTIFFDEYNQLYMQYESLNVFFKSLDASTNYIESYFYSHDHTYYEKYMENISVSKNMLEFLSVSSSDEDIAWEFKKLSNMLDTYEETVEKAVQRDAYGRGAYMTAEFAEVTNVSHLINRLAVNYFNEIIKDMSIKKDVLYNNFASNRVITLLILAAIIVIGGTFSVMLLWSVTKPINALVANVRSFAQGNYSNSVLQQVKGGGSEIDILFAAFNNMAKSLQFYLKEINEKVSLKQLLLEQENENLRINNVLRETEFRALQSQMNPHFLFNTLSIISKMAYIEGADQTTMLMESAMQLLRYSVDNSGKTSDLQAEIECIKNYFYIQQKRFGDRLQLEMCVDPNLPNIKMPALIIQPLVENAVIHGVGDVVRGGSVKLTVSLAGKQINICIEDNGCGISSETIETILSSDSGAQDCVGIGIVNVKNRLEFFFGAKDIIYIDSSPNCGTVVTMKLPVQGPENEIDV